MILSTLTEYLCDVFGDEKAVRMIADAGFDAVDFSMFYMLNKDCPLHKNNYLDYIKRIKAVGEDNGVFFNQAHAPFPSYRFEDIKYSDEAYLNIVKAIEIAGTLGVKNIVVHPVRCPKEIDQLKFNIEFYNSLLPYAKEYGVKIALENMFEWDSRREVLVASVCGYSSQLAEYYDSLDSEWFSVCLDLGHCGLVGEEAYCAIRNLGGKRLTALHVHDNNYKNDLHTLPYLGNLDWDEILKALADINYQGDFTYEVTNFYNGFDKELIPTALKFMHDTGRNMISKLEKYKNN